MNYKKLLKIISIPILITIITCTILVFCKLNSNNMNDQNSFEKVKMQATNKKRKAIEAIESNNTKIAKKLLSDAIEKYKFINDTQNQIDCEELLKLITVSEKAVPEKVVENATEY